MIILKEQITQHLNVLLRCGGIRDSNKFFSWQQESRTILWEIDKTLGSDFRDRFDAISYVPHQEADPTIDIRGYNDDYDIALRYAEEAHNKGILQAQGVLGSANEWVKKYWPTSQEQMNRSKLFSESLHEQTIPKEIEEIPLIILNTVPDVDMVIIKYLTEAINCIKIDAFLAATMMIGGASEKAILLLIEVFTNHITKETTKKEFTKKMDSRDISKKYQHFEASFKGCKNKPPKHEDEIGFDMAISRAFHFCRMTRNEVGHPKTIPHLEFDTLMMPLRYFPIYIKRIYELIEHFQKNGVEL
jgi:hypothetical protein